MVFRDPPIVPEHHKDLCDYNMKDPKVIKISGPKGVGKSTSLYMFKLELTIAAKDQDPIIVYLSDGSSNQSTNDCFKNTSNL